MRWLVVLALVALPLTALVSCSDYQSPTKCIVRSSDGDTGCSGSLDGGVVVEPPPICSPLLQVNCQPAEKCTWLIDETVPHLIGHIGCAPEGTAAIGAPCMFGAPGATGFDNCAKGSVCSAFASPGEPGTCKAICDNAGGTPMCDAAHACVAEFPLFNTGAASPAAGGVCEPACDPLADNDFDGPGSALSRSGSACGSAENGCYGIPSEGTPPRTQFWCAPELHYTTPLHHRTECTTATGCAATDGSIFVNSCNQGYEPLFRESTAVSTAVCVAFCKPLDCYAGNCGSGNANSVGAAPHRCANPDALGSFGSGEECVPVARGARRQRALVPSPTATASASASITMRTGSRAARICRSWKRQHAGAADLAV